MKPYIVVSGKLSAVSDFEKDVSEALEDSYSLAGNLGVCKMDGGADYLLVQTLIYDEDLDDEYDEDLDD